MRNFALATNVTAIFSKSAGAVAESVISFSVEGRIVGDLTMTLAVRKRLVEGSVLFLIGIANLGMFVSWLDTQGQRTLNSLRRKDFHQEFVAPAGHAAFSLDAVFGRMAFQQTDREAA